MHQGQVLRHILSPPQDPEQNENADQGDREENYPTLMMKSSG